jgi:hypothetical protein
MDSTLWPNSPILFAIALLRKKLAAELQNYKYFWSCKPPNCAQLEPLVTHYAAFV